MNSTPWLFKFCIELFHVGHFGDAWPAPGGPEIDDDHLAPKSLHGDPGSLDGISEFEGGTACQSSLDGCEAPGNIPAMSESGKSRCSCSISAIFIL